MAPFDAPQDQKTLAGLVRAFMLILSQRPAMTLEFSEFEMRRFPYDDYRLSAIEDDGDGSITFMLLREDEAGKIQ